MGSLDYLPHLIAYLNPERVICLPGEIWFCNEYTCIWSLEIANGQRKRLKDMIYQVISTLPEDQIRVAHAFTSNENLRRPLINEAIAVLKTRVDPTPDWDPPYVFALSNGKCYDFREGLVRNIRPTDYIRFTRMDMPYGRHDRNILKSLSTIDHAMVSKMYTDLASGDAEKGQFLMDIMAHALVGIPPVRIYLLQGQGASYAIQLHARLFGNYAFHNRYWTIGNAPYRSASMHLFREYRIIYSELTHGDINNQFYRSITDGSGAFEVDTTKERATYPQRSTLFFHAMSDKLITDPVLLQRTVVLDLGDAPTLSYKFLDHAVKNMDAFITILCERACLFTTDPPPMPDSVLEKTREIQSKWKVPTVEEWIHARVKQKEEKDTAAKYVQILQAYHIDSRKKQVEKVDHEVFRTILEGIIGPEERVKRVLAYQGWKLEN